MKAMLRSTPTDEMSGARSRASAQRRQTGSDLRGNLSAESSITTSSLAAAPRIVAQRQQMQAAFGSVVQRADEEEEPLQGKLLPAQRQDMEEEPLQGKFETAQRVADELAGAHAENKTGMPDQLKAGVESLSGMSMDNVKVHYSSSQPAQLNALAYAQGTDIHLAPGQEHHLPHEAWHVVQQAEGRVQPTMQMRSGVPINDDAGLEHEADVMGSKAAGLDPVLVDNSR